MNSEIQGSGKTSYITGNRPWDDSARMVEDPSSFSSLGKEAEQDLPSSGRENRARPLVRFSFSKRKVLFKSTKNHLSLARFTYLAFISFLLLLAFIFSDERTAEASLAGSLPSPQQQEEEAKIAARGMEAVLVQQMISEMRKSVPENDLMPKSHAERVYEGMLDQEYARVLSESANLGISSLILDELLRHKVK